MNIGRAINAGEITFYTDCTFNISKNNICLFGVQVGKSCYGTVPVEFSVNPSESEDAMRATFDGLESCFFCLFRSLQVCEVVDCMFYRNVQGKEFVMPMMPKKVSQIHVDFLFLLMRISTW